jgi:predicted regulator of Ras-like GTPase activity (Roadblock/LC7/MglB family)
MSLLRRLWGGAPRTSLRVAEALRRAEQRRRDGWYDEAALVARVLELDPQNLHAHLLAGYLHAARRAPAPAKAEFGWVLGHDANHPRALVGLARIALEENDARVCQELLRRALRCYPEFPEAAALLHALHAREASAVPAQQVAAAARMERLRLPGGGRAFIVGRADGGLVASLPTAADAKDIAESMARVLRLAAAALQRAGLGAAHRAIVEDDRDAVFIRTDGELVVSLALQRATDPIQGLLDVNRLWSATLHELGLAAAPPTSPATPVSTPAVADSTRRAS